jgi:hypothetical protein
LKSELYGRRPPRVNDDDDDDDDDARGLRKNLEAVPGKHSIYSLQKTAILGTSHTVRKVLQSET